MTILNLFGLAFGYLVSGCVFTGLLRRATYLNRQSRDDGTAFWFTVFWPLALIILFFIWVHDLAAGNEVS